MKRMKRMKRMKQMPFILAIAVLCAVPAIAQDMPADYKQVVDMLGKTADFKDGVLKVNIPGTTCR